MSVTPYLTLTDAKAAIDFYVEAFGAVEQFRLPADDGKKTMHAVLGIAGGTIFLSDMGPSAPPASVSVALGRGCHGGPGGRSGGYHQLRAAGHVLGRPLCRADRSLRPPLDTVRAQGLKLVGW